MLDIERGWEEFNRFENYVFNPDDEDFFQFTGKWNIRHQALASVDSDLSYPNSLLAFKLLRNSSLSAHVQSRVISALKKEYQNDCNIIHLIMYLMSKETQNKQNFISQEDKEVNKSVKHCSSSDKDKFPLDVSGKQGALVKHELCDAEEVEAETHEYEDIPMNDHFLFQDNSAYNYLETEIQDDKKPSSSNIYAISKYKSSSSQMQERAQSLEEGVHRFSLYITELFDSLEPKLRAQAERRQEYIKDKQLYQEMRQAIERKMIEFVLYNFPDPNILPPRETDFRTMFVQLGIVYPAVYAPFPEPEFQSEIRCSKISDLHHTTCVKYKRTAIQRGLLNRTSLEEGKARKKRKQLHGFNPDPLANIFPNPYCGEEGESESKRKVATVCYKCLAGACDDETHRC
ncbi:uncharacterized protein LOC111704777 [Eurytemora carolleeae]|uniref:uncharacterized protein LOC111704777 n=1 Tax=Eurytemora carolleeae TaxID=1294199 RepID=UPI000C794698|nr:uncharacterized protein LOC111704777 [Eurytemora carolleeae]|eukprot:XP_023332892.1 uncharacterized protein LOC111704777 [Eurytemora affinis]